MRARYSKSHTSRRCKTEWGAINQWKANKDQLFAQKNWTQKKWGVNLAIGKECLAVNQVGPIWPKPYTYKQRGPASLLFYSFKFLSLLYSTLSMSLTTLTQNIPFFYSSFLDQKEAYNTKNTWVFFVPKPKMPQSHLKPQNRKTSPIRNHPLNMNLILETMKTHE